MLTPPDAAGTIEAFGSLGYTLESAVADLVDNSIDAGASEIDIAFLWDGAHSHVIVADNGRGMDEAELTEAMRPAAGGGLAVGRAAHELGRFGMGLKTASFSQARELVVWSRTGKAASPAARTWDLDLVLSTNEWRLLIGVPAPSASLVEDAAKGISRGTVVLWNRLTKLVRQDTSVGDEEGHRQFLSAIRTVEVHLAMVFHRFISGTKLLIRINGQRLVPWDPYLKRHSASQALPPERIQCGPDTVLVEPFVLPQRRRLTDDEHAAAAGPDGWLAQQGFYVYRNDRLIVAGDWLGLGLRKDDAHVLARISVDLPSSLDREWSIDVKKATARPPLSLRPSLLRLAKVTRARASAVLSAREKVNARAHSDDLSYVWRVEDEGARLNWAHPLVKEALRLAGDAKPDLHALLRFVEETVPISALRVIQTAEGGLDYTPFQGSAPEEVVEVAHRIYRAYVSQGLSPKQATTRLVSTPPFNEFPRLLVDMGLSE